MAGLQFDRFGLSGFRTFKNNIFYRLVESNPVKLKTIHTLILPPPTHTHTEYSLAIGMMRPL